MAKYDTILDLLGSSRLEYFGELNIIYSMLLVEKRWLKLVWDLVRKYVSKIFKNALGQFIPNCPPKHVITRTN